MLFSSYFFLHWVSLQLKWFWSENIRILLLGWFISDKRSFKSREAGVLMFDNEERADWIGWRFLVFLLIFREFLQRLTSPKKMFLRVASNLRSRTSLYNFLNFLPIPSISLNALKEQYMLVLCPSSCVLSHFPSNCISPILPLFRTRLRRVKMRRRTLFSLTRVIY